MLSRLQTKLVFQKIIITGVGFVFILGYVRCQSGKENNPKETTPYNNLDSLITTGDSTKSPNENYRTSEPISRWEYNETEDKMTSKTNYYASITANEELQFDFPYDGGSTATFTIRKKEGSTSIYLQVSKGQFNNTFDGGTVRIRFDQTAPKRYSFSEASDGSSDIIFINSEREIISKLKSSQKMLVEAEFYDAGTKQMEFDVSGFKWEH